MKVIEMKLFLMKLNYYEFGEMFNMVIDLVEAVVFYGKKLIE